MSGQLAGKVAVVTGSTQGLGAAIARASCARARASSSPDARERRARRSPASWARRASSSQTDLARSRTARPWSGRARGVRRDRRSRQLRGDTNRSTVRDFTPEPFDRVFHLNLRAPLLLAQAALPSLKERPRGHRQHRQHQRLHGRAPPARLRRHQGRAPDRLAEPRQRPQVRAGARLLPERRLDGHRRRASDDGEARPPSDFLEKAGKLLPLGRMLKPEEVAEACLFLASDQGRGLQRRRHRARAVPDRARSAILPSSKGVT